MFFVRAPLRMHVSQADGRLSLMDVHASIQPRVEWGVKNHDLY